MIKKTCLLKFSLLLVLSNSTLMFTYTREKSFRIQFYPTQTPPHPKDLASKIPNGIELAGNSPADKLNEISKGKSIKHLSPDGSALEKKKEKQGLHFWHKVTISNNLGLASALIEDNGVHNISVAETIQPKNMLKARSNDNNYGQQWHYRNLRQTGRTADTNIALREIGNIQTNSPKMIVSILNCGIDYVGQDVNIDGDHPIEKYSKLYRINKLYPNNYFYRTIVNGELVGINPKFIK